jgi:hypothetical protein
MTDTTHTNPFRTLFKIDVDKYVEKKGQFSYLSWPFAVSQLRLADPTASWEVKRFNGLPYLASELGVFVEVAVTVQGITLSQIHPVLDSRNRPIATPTAFDINTSIQRCLVKAIALHGLGLNIYAGEDLPDTSAEEVPSKPAAPVTPFPKRPAPVVVPTEKPGINGNNDSEILSPAQLKLLKKTISEYGVDVVRLLAYFGFTTLETIPKNQVDRVIKAIQQFKQKEAA